MKLSLLKALYIDTLVPFYARSEGENIFYIVLEHLDKKSKIDILLEDYDEASIKALSSLLNTMAKDVCFLETVEFLRTSLIEENQTEVLMKILLNIADTINNKMNNISAHDKTNQPCIKPSDLNI